MGHLLQTPHSGLQWDGFRKIFFEGWYFRLTLPEIKQTFVFIYSIHNPGDPARFSGGIAQVLGPNHDFFWRTFPHMQQFWAWPHALGVGHWRKSTLNDLPGYLSPGQFDTHIAEGYQATATWHQGKLHEPALGKTIRWQYSIEPIYGWGASRGVQKSTTGLFSQFHLFEPGWQVLMAHGLATGWIEWDGKYYSFSQAPTYSEKNWGRTFPKKWFWLNCNTFEQQTHLSLTAAGGQHKFLGWVKPMAMIGLHYQGHLYEFLPWTATVQWEVHPWGYWCLRARSGDYQIEIVATLMAQNTPKSSVIMHVPTENGLSLACQDTTNGYLSLKLYRIQGNKLELIVEAESSLACLEVGGTPWDEPWVHGF